MDNYKKYFGSQYTLYNKYKYKWETKAIKKKLEEQGYEVLIETKSNEVFVWIRKPFVVSIEN
jgi:hypothetical protein